MDSLFHGCTYVNSDGTRKLIAKGHNCLIRTNKCFWKDAADVKDQVNDKERECSFFEDIDYSFYGQRKRESYRLKMYILLNNNTADFIYSVCFLSKTSVVRFLSLFLNEQESNEF